MYAARTYFYISFGAKCSCFSFFSRLWPNDPSKFNSNHWITLSNIKSTAGDVCIYDSYTVKTDWLKQPYFLVATFLKFVILTNCELVSENDQLNLVPLTLFNWSK